MLGEGVEAEEEIQQLRRKLGTLAAEGGAMPLVKMDGFVAGLVAHGLVGQPRAGRERHYLAEVR